MTGTNQDVWIVSWRVLWMVPFYVLLMGLAGPAAQAQNLVTNGYASFDENPLQGWTDVSGDLDGGTCCSLSPRTGIAEPGYFQTASAGPAKVKQTISDLVGGESYRFRVYLANINGSTDTLTVTLQFQDSGGNDVGTTRTLLDRDSNVSDGTWEEVEVTGITAPSNATQAVLSVAVSAPDASTFSEVFADDIFLTGPTSAAVEHVANRSFEGGINQPANWSISTNSGSRDLNVGIVSNNFSFSAKDGTKALIGGQEGVSSSTATQVIEGITEGELHDFSLWVANESSTDDLDVSIQFQDGSGSDVGDAFTLSNLNGGNGSWQQVTLTDMQAPSGAEQAVVTLTYQNNDGNYIDVVPDLLSFTADTNAPPSSPPVPARR